MQGKYGKPPRVKRWAPGWARGRTRGARGGSRKGIVE